MSKNLFKIKNFKDINYVLDKAYHQFFLEKDSFKNDGENGIRRRLVLDKLVEADAYFNFYTGELLRVKVYSKADPERVFNVGTFLLFPNDISKGSLLETSLLKEIESIEKIISYHKELVDKAKLLINTPKY